MDYQAKERPLGADADAFLRRHGWSASDPAVRAAASAIDDWSGVDGEWFLSAVARLRCTPGGYLWTLYRQSGRLMAYDLAPARM
jgi:hypothetical protein